MPFEARRIVLSSDERESQEAGAEQGDPSGSQRKKPIGNEISISHDTPSDSDALKCRLVRNAQRDDASGRALPQSVGLVPGPIPWYGSSAAGWQALKVSKLDIVRGDFDYHFSRAMMVIVFFVFGCHAQRADCQGGYCAEPFSPARPRA